MEWSAELPLPPSVNRTYKAGINRSTGKPQFYMSPEANAWKERAWLALLTQGFRQLPQRVSLALAIHVRSSAKRDLDAGAKLMQDVIAESLGQDDADVLHLTISKRVTPKAEHGCTIRVRTL